jgi:hypothetical protein
MFLAHKKELLINLANPIVPIVLPYLNIIAARELF